MPHMPIRNIQTLSVEVDDRPKSVYVISCYRIPKGTLCWLVRGTPLEKRVSSFYTEKEVIYTDADKITSEHIHPDEYHFRLPPNNKSMEIMICKKQSVENFNRYSVVKPDTHPPKHADHYVDNQDALQKMISTHIRLSDHGNS